jgi:ribosome maturation protein SDO1
MVDIDKAIIAKLRVKGENFEILVDCDKALEFRHGKCSLSDALATKDIFKDVRKGEHASEKHMKEFFGTGDPNKVAAEIIKKGDIQLTTEYKHKLKEEKRRQVITMISRNSINAQTNKPNPPQRIERAMEQAKVNIDEFRPAEEQLDMVVKKLSVIMPIRMEVREVMIAIPAEYAANSYQILKNYGRIIKDEWQNDGGLTVVMEVPAGMQEGFESELNKLTHGNVNFQLLKAK